MAGVDWEDNRIGKETWPEMKPKTPFGSVPVLEFDGKQYAQSNAILRYAGKLGGLYPSEPLLALEVDMQVDAIEDMFLTIRPTMAIKDEDEKMAARKVLAEETLPKWLAIFNQTIKDNGSGFLAGDSMSIADLKFYATTSMLMAGFLDGIPASIFDNFPEILAHKAAVSGNEKIKAYEAKTYGEAAK